MRKQIEITKAAKITRGKHYSIGRLYEADTTLELDTNRTNGNNIYIQIHDALLFDKKHNVKKGYVVNTYSVDTESNVIVKNQSRVLSHSTALNEASKFREEAYSFFN